MSGMYAPLPSGRRTVWTLQSKENREGKIISINYGKITGLMLDPIEKKPLRRFCPGSRILSVGSFGCNLACPFCQNYEISMTGEPEAEYKEISPKSWPDLPGNTGNMETSVLPLPTMSRWWGMSLYGTRQSL